MSSTLTLKRGYLPGKSTAGFWFEPEFRFRFQRRRAGWTVWAGSEEDWKWLELTGLRGKEFSSLRETKQRFMDMRTLQEEELNRAQQSGAPIHPEAPGPLR